LLTAVAAILNLPAFSAMAEEQQPIIVTATKTAQTADDTISPVIVISRENLETQTGAEIADILHHYAGIDIGRNGGPGQQTSIFIRGANSNHTLVMIDGVNINPDIGNAPLQNIRLDMIERIEIIKGPRSTLYGSQAIGGVINIITRQAKEGSHYEVHASGGSFATSEYGFSAHNKSGDSAAGITFNTSSSDGFPTLSTPTINRGYENMSVNLYGKRKLGNTHLKFTHNFSRGTTEYMAGFPTPGPVDQDFENSLTALSINNNPSTNWASKVKLSFIKDLIEQNQSTSYVQTKRSVIDWQNDIQVNDSNLLTAGLSASHERATSGTSFDEKIYYYALFIQD
ncbi:MAG: TonB-dependent receptor, partial [Gammaproteobacteria bacterium]|nr:TonB-dependent receptor [Gammaproteobacteria bacterium]